MNMIIALTWTLVLFLHTVIASTTQETSTEPFEGTVTDVWDGNFTSDFDLTTKRAPRPLSKNMKIYLCLYAYAVAKNVTRLKMMCICYERDPCVKQKYLTYFDKLDAKIWETFKEENYGLLVLFSVGWLVGVTGNILVLVAVGVYLKKDSATNVYLAGLAVADLLLVLFCFPLKAQETIWKVWMTGHATCVLMYFIKDFSAACSAFTLTLISIERYMAICNPMKAKRVNSVSRSRGLLAVVWVLAILCASPLFYFIDHIDRQRLYDTEQYFCTFRRTLVDAVGNYNPDPRLPRYHSLGMTVVVFGIPFLIMSVMYGLVCRALWLSTKRVQKMQGSGIGDEANKPKKETGRTSVIRMLISIVVVFFLCWGPTMVFRMYTAWGGTVVVNSIMDTDKEVQLERLRRIGVYIEILAYFNSIMNPILYALLSSQFRGVFSAILRCQCKRLQTTGLASSSGTASTAVSRSRTEVSVSASNQSVKTVSGTPTNQSQDTKPTSGVSTEQIGVTM